MLFNFCCNLTFLIALVSCFTWLNLTWKEIYPHSGHRWNFHCCLVRWLHKRIEVLKITSLHHSAAAHPRQSAFPTQTLALAWGKPQPLSLFPSCVLANARATCFLKEVHRSAARDTVWTRDKCLKFCNCYGPQCAIAHQWMVFLNIFFFNLESSRYCKWKAAWPSNLTDESALVRL